jgi:hypothetical protein
LPKSRGETPLTDWIGFFKINFRGGKEERALSPNTKANLVIGTAVLIASGVLAVPLTWILRRLPATLEYLLPGRAALLVEFILSTVVMSWFILTTIARFERIRQKIDLFKDRLAARFDKH